VIVAEIAPELRPYLDELVSRLSAVVELDAVYLFGSAAQGAYEHGRSDVDVIAVTPQALSRNQKRALAASAESLPCPARKLELVVYTRGAERHELNVNTGELVHLDAEDDPAFWFILDRAIAEQHSVPLLGPPWEDVFEPVPREAVLAALEEALDSQERDDPLGCSSLLNAVRGWRWLETGEWASKPDAAAWLRERVRAEARAPR
jgi:Aminoglycoside adenylyltransferase, C-terminal domain/Polymerase beta, Nucleotidyltransferase